MILRQYFNIITYFCQNLDSFEGYVQILALGVKMSNFWLFPNIMLWYRYNYWSRQRKSAS